MINIKMVLTDVEDGQLSGQDDDQGFVVIQTKGFGRSVLVRYVSSYRREWAILLVKLVLLQLMSYHIFAHVKKSTYRY